MTSQRGGEAPAGGGGGGARPAPPAETPGQMVPGRGNTGS